MVHHVHLRPISRSTVEEMLIKKIVVIFGLVEGGLGGDQRYPGLGIGRL